VRVRWKRESDPGTPEQGASLSSRRFRVRKETFQEPLAALPEAPNASSQVAPLTLRIAVYELPGLAPRTRDLVASTAPELIEEAVRVTFDEIQEQGGQVPLLAIQEVVENLVHAEFRGASISILDGGSEVIVADRGGGIPDPEAAVRPGFSTAAHETRRTLRGVGSGLSLAAGLMAAAGGRLLVESNLAGGTVVSLRLSSPGGAREVRHRAADPGDFDSLGERQRQVLLALADGRETGPSLVAEHVGCSLATAFRDLVQLEQMGLVFYVGRGKRVVSPEGLRIVSRLLQGPAWSPGGRAPRGGK
jgi:hypothetical protein